ncbi:MAG: GTPase Era [Gammaproteobacteria bacterium]|nr:GTPase Era [Gammaproteobacteria bacterium]
MSAGERSGFVALIGRPNVGKSTLLNRLVGQKLSITSRRPQTTRHRILGIKTTDAGQTIYVDTPGIHDGRATLMNRALNRAARASLAGVDCVVLVIAAPRWTDDDERVLAILKDFTCPVILAINKIDKLKDRERLLTLIDALRAKRNFAAIVPLAARSGRNVADLEAGIARHLPAHPAYFPADQVSDRGERFQAAELVREQIFRGFGEELPYATAVEIEQFKREPKLIRIDAVIWVEKPGQKAIVIGKGGERLKEVGRHARLEMQKLFGSKVYLALWVKVRAGWSDDARALRSLGYTDEH